jgi:hypothetical protein
VLQTYTSKETINNLVENLIQSSKTKSTESKIVAINKVCEGLVDENITPTIALVVKYLKQDAIKITTRTIYNQREGGNPYRQLIDAWIEFANFKASKSKAKVRKDIDAQNIVEEEDLSSINDPVLRYRVSLLCGEIKGLRNQLNIARQVKNLPAIGSGEQSSTLEAYQQNSLDDLDDYDFGILNDFLSGSSNASFDKDGALTAKFYIRKNDKISNPGLKEAIEKLVRRARET